MPSDPRAPDNEPIPLLYGPEADTADAVPLVTPSEEEMGRHVAAQIAKADAARQAVQRQGQAQPGHVLSNELTAAVQIAAERAARLAALNPVVLGRPSPPVGDDDALPLPQSPAPAVAVAAARPAAGNGSGSNNNADNSANNRQNNSQDNSANATLPGGGVVSEAQPQQLGRYLVRKRLGRGRMSAVYRAHDPQLGRDVAIKFLHASVCEDEDSRLHFLQQARAAGSLSHPNIVAVHDVGEIDNRPYVAMELVDGQPLSLRLEEEGPLPLPEVISIGLQLALALEYASGCSIVHRDIKPANIMLLAAWQNGDPKIKVADFGIAQAVQGVRIMPNTPSAPSATNALNAPNPHSASRADAQATRRLQGAAPGSLLYMSPEQARGEAAVDGRSDLFSAGVVLYQMLAGVCPFSGANAAALAACIANDSPPPLAQKRPDVPPALRRVIERCLAKQPEQRYASAKDLAEALLRVQVELAEAERVRRRPRQVPLRVKWAAAMALVVTLMMALSLGLLAQRQYAVLLAQVGDHGRSLVGVIAVQHAAQVLGEEWDSIDLQVQDVMGTRSIERLIVVDAAGMVRVSSLPALVGQTYRPEGQSLPELSVDGTTVRRFSSQGQSLLGFDAPVLFQGKPLGRVMVGLAEGPLTRSAWQSFMLMLALAGMTVLAVAAAAYFLASWFARPIRTVAEAMAEIGKGRLEHRIAEPRNDDFGQLNQAFDAMAQALQRRSPGADHDDKTRKR